MDYLKEQSNPKNYRFMYHLTKTFKTSVLNSLMSTETHKINEIRKTMNKIKISKKI